MPYGIQKWTNSKSVISDGIFLKWTTFDTLCILEPADVLAVTAGRPEYDKVCITVEAFLNHMSFYLKKSCNYCLNVIINHMRAFQKIYITNQRIFYSSKEFKINIFNERLTRNIFTLKNVTGILVS